MPMAIKILLNICLAVRLACLKQISKWNKFQGGNI